MKTKTYKKSIIPAMFIYLLLMPSIARAVSLGTAPNTGAGATGLVGKIENIVTGFITLTAVVAIIFIVIGGVQYLISAGDDKKASAAKYTILYAIIGLIVIALAGAIVNFVISKI